MKKTIGIIGPTLSGVSAFSRDNATVERLIEGPKKKERWCLYLSDRNLKYSVTTPACVAVEKNIKSVADNSLILPNEIRNMTTTMKTPRKHSDQAIADIKKLIQILLEKAPELKNHTDNHETGTFYGNLDVLEEHIKEIELAIHDAKNDNEIVEINNKKLRETIDEKNTEIESLKKEVDDFQGEVDGLRDEIEEVRSEKNSEINSLEDDVIKLEKTLEMSNFPTATLDDENKNKVLRNIHHNLSLEQIEKLEKFAKDFMPHNIIYKEVV